MIVYFYTLGCKVNQYETEAMRRLVTQAGFEAAGFEPGMPDIGHNAVVVNSCTVTGESDRKLRQLLRRIRRDHPAAVLALTGCMPQAFPEKAAELAEADIVLGNASRRDIAAVLQNFLKRAERTVSVSDHSRVYEPLTIDSFSERTRAFVKIEDGCNRFCSYCIIPYARGRVRSRSAADLKQELETLSQRGYKEVVLTGINLTAYGQDTGETLCDAVKIACAVPGIERVRLGSLEPDYITEEIICRLAAEPKFCPQFHLSLQSGCNATLKRMNRHYTAEEYAALCAQLEQAFPGCAFTTDVMVGFPGETDEEFEESLRFVESIGFAKLHVFAYSRRPGTPAATAPHQVTAAVKAARSRRLIAGGERCGLAYRQKQIGAVTTVLAETKQENGTTEGYTPTYIPVRVAGAYAPGEMITVRIIGTEEDYCTAKPI